MRWAANTVSALSFVSHLVLLSGISIISRCHTLTAPGFIISVLPIGGANTMLFNRLPPARRWRLPCLMTLLLLYPALSKHSVRHGETLNFCNGLKWSKYHSPPCICYSFKPRYHLLPNFLVHWQRQRAFPWRGNPCGFRASLNLALCSFHSNYPESFHTFCHRNSREGPFS